MKAQKELETIFRADREAREAEARLFQSADSGELAEVLQGAVADALAAVDRKGASVRLERLSDLCAQVPGPEMVDSLIDILNDTDPAVRVEAGEALMDVGYERYAEVARAVERAQARSLRGPAMAELPWIVAEIGEPSALGLIRGFLEHPEADAVAAAIEALASLGDAGAVELLKPLVGDDRRVAMDDFEDETNATIGELAEAALQELSQP